MAYYPAPYEFSETDMTVAVTIAPQFGFGIERMRAEDERQSAEGAS
jgi:GAF domain-containing protein